MQRLNEDPLFNKIILGVKKFQDTIYPEKQELFRSLAKKQSPEIMFITCSDSRIDPSLITQTEPGSLFLLHNAGNIIPPHGSPYGGTGASIEYAVQVLGVKHIVVCGHSDCGAMSALLDSHLAEEISIVRHWLSYADATRAILKAEAGNLSGDARLNHCAERNVQVQLTHLQTIPSVAARLVAGSLSLHGWFYQIETGKISVYDARYQRFVSFEEAYAVPAAV